MRWIALSLCATLIAPTALAENRPKLLVWINGDKGYNGLQRVGDAFERQTGVKVEVQHPEGAPEKFQQAAGAGKGPDVFCWPHDRVGEWAKAGLIVPVRPNKAIRDEIESSAWNAFRYRGKVWGYPIAIEANGLIYNKDLVPTPPATFDDVLALDAELSRQGKKAILWDFNKSFFSWPMLAGAGGYVFGQDANGDYVPQDVGVNTPGAVKAGETLKRLVDAKVMPKGARYAEMEAGFARGSVAMMISGPWAWDNARKAKINFGVAPIPAVVRGQPSQPFVGVLGCMISAPSKLKDVAREFVENHLLRPEQLKVVNADVPLGVPANKAFYAELSADPNIRATMENARLGRPVPNVPEVGRFWTAMDAALEAITNGLQSPQDALDGAAARMKVTR
ncbi:MAG: maltose/maltodextrin ABC transporter substrate-binding protein MalE [Inhella sp.]|jgi:maltose/maltodextrin transport system substrate-binding protein|uniref:maltose/maltodextrin ABC transporter substrate-binding protein MalE n=1 Tax=Inhella sp. TaxID=1921806 RepID=UPI0022C0766E|nr:maltose/maltodextrin ABC transporter substrate-binding protein MalE [Inhella sp.]MCZ8233520.1 maltose/maltodextrin ABC transporter substrate-binding protein MalE [Inhella sp.]